MDLGKILEKKELEASGSGNSCVKEYKRTHLVEFNGHTIPYYEYEALKEIMQKYNLYIGFVGFGNEHITKLNLYSKGIKSIEEIPQLESLTNLKELYLHNNQITEIKGLENLTNLQILNLHNNEITEISGLENLTNLKELYLHNNQITEIKNLDSLTNLQKLYLWDNKLNSESERVIKSLRKGVLM